MLHLSLAGAFAILFVGAIPGVASAHAFLISSSPPAGARLGTAPGVVTLRYSEAVQPGLSQASVIDPTGHRFTGTVSATSITIPLATNAPGTYRVGWKVVAADDGHTTHGTFEFSVVSAGAAAGGQAGPGATGFLASVFRAVQYAALLAAIGMLLLSSLARRDPPVPWVRPRLRIALAVLLAAGAATAAVDALSASSSLAGAGRYVVSTSPGVARLAAVALEVLALGAAVVGAPVWPALGAAAVAIAASGHPADVHPAWWGISVDAAHLAAAGLWAGAIMALATIRAPGGWRGEEGRRLLDRFSPVALAAFGTTVALGVVQALVFLPSLGAFLHSDYGRVLGVKILAVGAMVPLSVLAWRRRIVTRAEAGVAAVVVLAAALLSAYPLPRPTPAVAHTGGVVRNTALPRGEGLTLGDHVGPVLVGLTLRPGTPGRNLALVYLLPVEGSPRQIRVQVSDGEASRTLASCGANCRVTALDLTGGERLAVHLGPFTSTLGHFPAGTVTFAIPKLPAPDGTALLAKAQRRMHALHTFRLDEVLNSGLTSIHTVYAFQAPNRMASRTGDQGAATVIIGGTRWLRNSAGGRWQVQKGGPPLPVPSFIWDSFKPYLDVRVIRSARVDGEPTRIVAFVGKTGGTPVWFRLWVDPTGLVRRAMMRTIGHFMDHRYYGFNARFTVRPPTPTS